LAAAVGYYFGPPIRPLIERWNAGAWKYVTSPNPGGRDGGALNAVTTIGDSGVGEVVADCPAFAGERAAIAVKLLPRESTGLGASSQRSAAVGERFSGDAAPWVWP
jgi:hypothetical protein